MTSPAAFRFGREFQVRQAHAADGDLVGADRGVGLVAEQVLARLRDLTQDPRWANDGESPAFLREAEALIVGESDAEAETGRDPRP